MDDKELKPCPFCGSAKPRLMSEFYGKTYITCDSCGVFGRIVSCVFGKEEAEETVRKHWNTRALGLEHDTGDREAPGITFMSGSGMDIMKRLEAEQHKKLKELQEKLSEVLDYEPADSGDETEDEIWRQANDLKSMLDSFFFESKCGQSC